MPKDRVTAEPRESLAWHEQRDCRSRPPVAEHELRSLRRMPPKGGGAKGGRPPFPVAAMLISRQKVQDLGTLV